jgi:hypothetical protein
VARFILALYLVIESRDSAEATSVGQWRLPRFARNDVNSVGGDKPRPYNSGEM